MHILIADNKHPLPKEGAKDRQPATFAGAMGVSAKTGAILAELGAPIDIALEDVPRHNKLFSDAVRSQDRNAFYSMPMALSAHVFLRKYATGMALDITMARSAITNKLMELAHCGDNKIELRALELLGKHSDIGLFTERSEVTVRHTSAEDLEATIRERVSKILNSDLIDVTPVPTKPEELDAVLGVFDEAPDAG